MFNSLPIIGERIDNVIPVNYVIVTFEPGAMQGMHDATGGVAAKDAELIRYLPLDPYK